MSSWTDEDEDGGTCPSSPSIMFMGRRRRARGQCRVWMPLPPLSRVKSYPESYPIPSTVKLSSTSHNDSYSDRGLTSPIFLASPTGHSPMGTSSTGNSHCPTNAGQCGWCHYTHSPTCSKSSGTGCSPGVDGRGATRPFATPHLWGLNWDPQLILTCQLVDLPPPRHPQYGDVHPIHGSQPV